MNVIENLGNWISMRENKGWRKVLEHKVIKPEYLVVNNLLLDILLIVLNLKLSCLVLMSLEITYIHPVLLSLQIICGRSCILKS